MLVFVVCGEICCIWIIPEFYRILYSDQYLSALYSDMPLTGYGVSASVSDTPSEGTSVVLAGSSRFSKASTLTDEDE